MAPQLATAGINHPAAVISVSLLFAPNCHFVLSLHSEIMESLPKAHAHLDHLPDGSSWVCVPLMHCAPVLG